MARSGISIDDLAQADLDDLRPDLFGPEPMADTAGEARAATLALIRPTGPVRRVKGPVDLILKRAARGLDTFLP